MSIFKKKEVEEDDFGDKRSFSKLKDLKSENKRKRKEPEKPWGKKERLVVLYFFLATILIAGFLFLSSRSWKLPNLPRIEIPKFNLFESETVIIGNGEGITFDKNLSQKITDYFSENTKSLTGTYAFYVIDLESGHGFGVGENAVLQAASLIKLPVFTAVFEEAEDGRLDLEEIYSLKTTDISKGAGSLQYKSPGFQISYLKLLEKMGKESDNTAFTVFRNLIGERDLQDYIFKIGMNDTSVKENKTSAYNVAMFFKDLWENRIVSQKNRDLILDFLTDTIYEEYIPKGIAEVKVSHKYGRETNVINDAGIVFGSKPFVLVVLTEGIIKEEADGFIPEFSGFVYQTLE